VADSIANRLSKLSPTDSVLLRAKFDFEEGLDLVFLEFANSDVDSGGPETIWPLDGLYTLPTFAAATTIVSDNANDTAAGTGAQEVIVSGLDAERNQIEEVISLNGTSVVTLTQQFFRVNRIEVTAAGSSMTNEGLLTLQIGGGDAGAIAAGAGLSGDGFYAMPNEKVYTQGLLCYQKASTSRNGNGFADVMINRHRGGLKQMIFDIGLNYPGSSAFQETNIVKSFILEPGDDIVFDCTASSNNTKIEGTCVLLLFKA
jgi:hypothetical protein